MTLFCCRESYYLHFMLYDSSFWICCNVLPELGMQPKNDCQFLSTLIKCHGTHVVLLKGCEKFSIQCNLILVAEYEFN